MNEIFKLNAFNSSKMNVFMNLDSKEKIIKQTFVGVHNLEINKYISRNVTVIEGITGSGKTYYVENLFNFDTTKKLLLSSEADCEHEFLTAQNITKIGYYKNYYDLIYSFDNTAKSLFTTLQKELKKNYEIIIIENIFLTSSDLIFKLFDLCLKYPNSKFYIINNII